MSVAARHTTRHAARLGARTASTRGHRVQEGRARLSALACADTFELTDRLFDLGWCVESHLAVMREGADLRRTAGRGDS